MTGPYLPTRFNVSVSIVTVDQMLVRLKALLPPWFGDDETPILDAVLTGPAYALAYAYTLIQYARLQTRIKTATDGFLDIAASDFFGTALPRLTGEADAAYRARILGSFFPARNTRPAVVAALTALGLTVQIIEPWNPADTGDLNNAARLAWNKAGIWGSRSMPSQCFAIVTRPSGSTITNAQIYAAIEGVRPAAITIWVQIID